MKNLATYGRRTTSFWAMVTAKIAIKATKNKNT